MLEAVRDVAFGVDQKVARQTDDALIRATTGRRWQFGGGRICDVDADHGEVATFKFPNIRATPAGGGLGAIGVRVRTDAFDKVHASLMTLVISIVNSFLRYE